MCDDAVYETASLIINNRRQKNMYQQIAAFVTLS